MSIIKGVQVVAGFHKAPTWGTPFLLGAGDGIGVVSEDIKADVQLIEDQQLEGSSQQRAGEAGNRLFTGSLTTGARYEGLEPIVAQVFGTAGTPTASETTGQIHVFKPNTDLDGIFGTFAIDRGFEVHEYSTCKVTGFSFSCKQGERASITFRLAAHNMAINTSSGTNNNTTMASVTVPSNREYLQFKHLVVWVGAQSGAALDTTNRVYVSGITIDVDRGYKVDDVNTEFGDKISEPEQDGWTMTKVSMDLPKYANGTGGSNSLFAAQLAKTAQMVKVAFTGETLAGSSSVYNSWVFWLNSVQFQSGTPNASGPGLTPFTLEGMAYRVSTIPTGFPTGYVDACTLVVTSKRSTDALSS